MLRPSGKVVVTRIIEYFRTVAQTLGLFSMSWDGVVFFEAVVSVGIGGDAHVEEIHS